MLLHRFSSVHCLNILFSPVKSQRDGIVGFWLNNSGFKSRHRQEIFHSPKHLDQLFSPPSIIFKGYQGSLQRILGFSPKDTRVLSKGYQGSLQRIPGFSPKDTKVLSKGYQYSLPRCEADHKCPFTTEVMNEWSNTSTPLIRPHGMSTGNSTLFLHLLKKEHCLVTEFSFSCIKTPPTFTVRQQLM